MEDFKLIPPNQNYYVYALIDPRDNEIFYIGKGKGNRYKAHISDYEKGMYSYIETKFQKIKKIKEEGLEVRFVKLIDYLSEEDAYKIEEILIYNIGRKAFNEGNLTNFMIGGNKKKYTYYYVKPINTSLLNKYKNSFNKEYIAFTKKISKIDFLSELEICKFYLYTQDGKELKEINSVDFFNHPYYHNLFKYFKEYKYPICIRYIISPIKLNKFYTPKYFSNFSGLYDITFFKLLDEQIKNNFFVRLEHNNSDGFKILATGPSFYSCKGNEICLDIKIFFNDNLIDFISGKIFVSQDIVNLNYKAKTLSMVEKKERDKASAEWEKHKGRLH